MSGPVVVVGLPPQHVQQQPQPLFLHHHHLHQQQHQQQQVMILNGYGSGDNGNAQGSGGAGSEESLEQAQELLQDKKSLSSMLAQRAMHERRLKPPDHVIPCPRCQSINTKFCYYNNYSLTQPRHFCKNCRRYWTAGGTLRNVPVGGGCRKNKRVKRTSAAAGGDASSSADSSVVSGGFRAEGVAAAGTAAVAAQTVVHRSFLQAAAAAATGGSSFFDNPQYDEATKAALARAQQAMRAGSSGVGHSSHESSPGGSEGHGGCSLSAPSLATQPFESGIMSQGFFGSASAAASKQQHDGSPSSAAATSAAAGGASGSGGGGPLSNGDLNAIFEAHAYRAAAAAAAGATVAGGDGGGLNGYSSHHVSDHVQDSYHHHHVDSSGDGGHAHWRLQQQQQQHSKTSSLWDEAEQHNNQAERDEAVQMPHSGSEHHHGHHHGHHHQQHHQHHQHQQQQQHYKSAAAAAAHAHAENLRHALKGKSSLCLSPSSGLDEEGTSPCSVWAAPANPSGVNPYDNAQDGGFSWPGAWTTPLELMPSSGNVPFGLRSEHLFDLPKPNLVNPVGFGLDEFHSDNRKLA